MTPRIDVYLSGLQDKIKLAQIAKRLGYIRGTYGVEMPNVSALIQAIASGEVEVIRTEQTKEGGE